MPRAKERSCKAGAGDADDENLFFAQIDLLS
jgi:hypothetical protein